MIHPRQSHRIHVAEGDCREVQSLAAHETCSTGGRMIAVLLDVRNYFKQTHTYNRPSTSQQDLNIKFVNLDIWLTHRHFWLPARSAFGFSGDHQQNIQCVLIYRCCVLTHVCCWLFSVGNKLLLLLLLPHKTHTHQKLAGIRKYRRAHKLSILNFSTFHFMSCWDVTHQNPWWKV